MGQKRTRALQNVMSALHPIATAKAKFGKRPCLLYPPKADMRGAIADVCFGPKADIGLFDYLISGLLQMQRHGKAECPGGLKVDYEHELGWCLYRKIAWIFAL